jgi:predicted ATPase
VPLIGRDHELALLDHAFAAAVAGRPSLVLLGGEAGVGKSALVGEMADRVRAAGGLAVAGGCLELAAGAVPFLPVVEALGALPRALGDRAWQRLVADSPPQLGWLLPGTVTPPDLGPLDPLATATARMQILDLLLELVRRLAGQRPIALIIEDVHWADASTRDLLAFLTRALRDDRVLLIATFRAEAVDGDERLRGWLAQLGRHEAASRRVLAPLTHAELAQYLGDVLGRAPDPALVDDVHRRCGGNPFMAQELVRAEGAGLPATLRDALLARIGALSPAGVDVGRWAAAGGGRIEHRLLAAVAGLPEAELGEAVRDAVRGAVLVADRDAARWAFRHDLLHEAAYDELLPGEREARHRALALALEADPAAAGTRDAAAAAVAGHWFAARDAAAALGAAVRAASAAARLRA